MLEPGTIIHQHYKIIQRLGESKGKGVETYLAKNLKLSPPDRCVIKRLILLHGYEQRKTVRRLFLKEVEVLKNLGQHPQIPKLIDFFEENQDSFLILEYIKGHELVQELSPQKIWSEIQVMKLLDEVLQVLSFVHDSQIIHRDIKPENLIRQTPENLLCLIDFGSVKEVTTSITNEQGEIISTVRIGTWGYMPKEQASGTPYFSSDLYAVGMIAVQALTGLHPLDLHPHPQTLEIMWRERAKVSEKFANFIDKMIRFDFRHRYRSAREALQDLSALS
ncbi:serine/threonine protein kinase [Desertifilum sp. FACHB-1129]|uniref:non-specific serine/threonine protein kinase n=2 Tax=Desertifilum tharense IPPAS B-1220 TaxID=1781255 RepID=A0A1E5QQ15_9CYAN|nr:MULTISPECIES: serine/threonine-protein kinase [Desertifilum]MDA0212166.1 serine/threonine-protein kinase [Cyanobacteria bacterium FC1]MBD2313221.1 serine/threonine protein kinase [Desertifilum sp. FACHB-1129]MBD2323516.1 serine/threonine protein kinase [Desertifilum sp. FACHB-866]MBD2334123.1 serine/threonine protein kinase [Desertifilum sp. FACHB-868]OEJ76711.1 hypothetical protein BH720_02820 [Desertifilum tharense IPPAS B-1220]